MLSAPELTNYNLHEVVTDITLAVPGGVFAGVSSANVNADRWKAMDDTARETMLWGGSHMTADTTWNFYTDDSAAIEHSRNAGINIHKPDAELLAAVKQFSRDDLKTVSALFKDTYEVSRADEIASDFEPLLAKWNDLVKDVESSDDLQTLIWDQVISKVDPATYAQ